MGTHTIHTRSPGRSFPGFITKMSSHPLRQPARKHRSLHVRGKSSVIVGVGDIGWSVPGICAGDVRRFSIPRHVFCCRTLEMRMWWCCGNGVWVDCRNLSLLVPGGDVAVYWHVGVYAHQLVEVEKSREKWRGREIDEDTVFLEMGREKRR